ncbi:MAG: O-antigen ligase family protein, partial [Saprospiraceae bacterium]|nr:O-antigen ligase family protein [Saprospiraceae bacterium]
MAKGEKMPISTGLFLITIFVVNTLVFSPELLDYFLYSRFLTASVFTASYAAYIAFWHRSQPMLVNLTDLIILAFVCWNAISISWSLNLGEAVFTAQRWLLFASVYFLLRIILHDYGKLFVSSISTLSLILSVVLMVIVAYHLIGIVKESGFSNKALYGLKVMFGHKSLTSAYLLMLMPLNLLQFHNQNFKQRCLLLALLGIQFTLILLLQSRTVYVSAAAFVAIIIWYFIRIGWKSQRTWLVFIPFVLVAVGLLAIFLSNNPELRERLNPLHYASSQTALERRFVWMKTIPLMEDNLLKGVGTGNWKIHFPKHGVEGAYRLQDQDVIFTRAHNDYLETTVELGLFGIVSFLALLLVPLGILMRLQTGDKKWQAHLLAAGLTAYIISSVFDFPKERIESLILLAIYLAMIVALALEYGEGLTTIAFPKIKLLAFACTITMVVNIVNGVNRYKGERGTRTILSERQAENWDQVIRAVDDAYNKLYSLDPAAVPLHFYKGIALYNQDKMPGAEQAFMTAYRDNPY